MVSASTLRAWIKNHKPKTGHPRNYYDGYADSLKDAERLVDRFETEGQVRTSTLFDTLPLRKRLSDGRYLETVYGPRYARGYNAATMAVRSMVSRLREREGQR